uniref:PRLI-interacting factor A n=1 Tax=Helianthus annuus TaxID=4232 RepID=A0A251VK13_HELAN
MLDQSQMMNHSQLMSQSHSQQMMLMNHLSNQNQLQSQRGYMTWQQNTKPSGYVQSRSNNNRRKTTSNTTSFLIRAKKSGGITSLVSPCPVTPAVLPTPIFSPSREVLVDMAKEEWGVDGYGSMKGLIRLRSDNDDGIEDDEGGSSESDVEEHEQEHEHEHLEVEKRLDHDLSRFEMVYPNYGGSDHVLENRVDDQDAHIARLEEENLMVKERLFLMEREFENLRARLQCLETRRQGAGAGARRFVEEVVENGSEDESGSRGYGRSIDGNSEVFEENKNNVVNQESDNGGKGDAAVDWHMENGIQKSEEKMNAVVEAKIGDDYHVNGMGLNGEKGVAADNANVVDEDCKIEDDHVNGDSCVNQ